MPIGPESEMAFDRWVKDELHNQFAIPKHEALPEPLERLLAVRTPERDQNKP